MSSDEALAGPAFIGQMPPAPETSTRWWTMYCRECGIEEGMARDSDDAALVARTVRHNRERHGESSDAMRCPGCDCHPVGWAPHNGKGDCPPKARVEAYSRVYARSGNLAVDQMENAAYRAGFEQGAEWERTRPVTDAAVEAARDAYAAKLWDQARSVGTEPNTERGRAEKARDRMRAALEAARKVEQ